MSEGGVKLEIINPEYCSMRPLEHASETFLFVRLGQGLLSTSISRWAYQAVAVGHGREDTVKGERPDSDG